MNIVKDKKNLIILCLVILLAGVLYFTVHKSSEARNTDALIMSIGEVTLDKEAAISQARTSYDALSDRHKKQVDHLEVLISAENEYEILYNHDAAEKADVLIRKADPEDKDSLDAAKDAYNRLTEDQKQLCQEYDSLLAAEKKHEELQAKQFDETAASVAEKLKQMNLTITDELSEQISALKETYESLSDTAKGMIQSNDIYSLINEAYSSHKISATQHLISSAVQTGEGFTEAIDSYNNLSSEEKINIHNYSDLMEAQKYYAEVKKRNSYIESCETVSYDDIRRYPDSYKGRNIKLNLVISEAKPDGWITDGDIFAVIAGTNNQVAVYDHRSVREPRILTGDHITVYGTANGLVKMKTYAKGTGILGSDLFAKTVDEKEIPAVNVTYTSNDDLSRIAVTPVSEEDYYYSKGAELAQKLNNYLEKLDEKIG